MHIRVYVHSTGAGSTPTEKPFLKCTSCRDYRKTKTKYHTLYEHNTHCLIILITVNGVLLFPFTMISCTIHEYYVTFPRNTCA